MGHAPVRRAGMKPVQVELKQGEVYVWCACGRSASQPFCDGSHQGTGIDPLVFEAEKDGLVLLCQCKQTKTPPLCDGSHRTLSQRTLDQADDESS